MISLILPFVFVIIEHISNLDETTFICEYNFHYEIIHNKMEMDAILSNCPYLFYHARGCVK